jgi:hypothetical protein
MKILSIAIGIVVGLVMAFGVGLLFSPGTDEIHENPALAEEVERLEAKVLELEERVINQNEALLTLDKNVALWIYRTQNSNLHSNIDLQQQMNALRSQQLQDAADKISESVR